MPTCTENLLKFGHGVAEICWRTCRHGQTHTYRDEVKMSRG